MPHGAGRQNRLNPIIGDKLIEYVLLHCSIRSNDCAWIGKVSYFQFQNNT
jgi:hypothetical protein